MFDRSPAPARQGRAPHKAAIARQGHHYHYDPRCVSQCTMTHPTVTVVPRDGTRARHRTVEQTCLCRVPIHRLTTSPSQRVLAMATTQAWNTSTAELVVKSPLQCWLQQARLVALSGPRRRRGSMHDMALSVLAVPCLSCPLATAPWAAACMTWHVLSFLCLGCHAPALLRRRPQHKYAKAKLISKTITPSTHYHCAPRKSTMLASVWSFTSTELSSRTYLAIRCAEFQHFIVEASSKQCGPLASTHRTYIRHITFAFTAYTQHVAPRHVNQTRNEPSEPPSSTDMRSTRLHSQTFHPLMHEHTHTGTHTHTQVPKTQYPHVQMRFAHHRWTYRHSQLKGLTAYTQHHC